MANANENTTPAPPTDPKAEPKPTPRTGRAKGLHERILKQGKAFDDAPRREESDEAIAGKFRVVHGRICFGHAMDNTESQYAYPGAIVELTVAESRLMLASGSVEKVAA